MNRSRQKHNKDGEFSIHHVEEHENFFTLPTSAAVKINLKSSSVSMRCLVVSALREIFLVEPTSPNNCR